MNHVGRIKDARIALKRMLDYENSSGTHTYHMCDCGRRGCRSLCQHCIEEKLADLDKQEEKYTKLGKPVMEDKE